MSLENFKSAMAAAWVATVPPDDDSDATYSLIDTLIEERGAGRHRQFVWREATETTTNDTASTLYGWNVAAEFFFERRNRTTAQFNADVQADIATLRRAHDNLTTMGVGVYEAVLNPIEREIVEPERPSRAGGVSRSVIARVTFPFDVLVGSSEISGGAMAHGQITMATGTASVATPGTFGVVTTGTWVSGELSGFLHSSNGQLLYTGGQSAVFRLEGAISFASPTLGPNVRQIQIAVNGAVVGQPTQETFVSSGGIEHMRVSCHYELQPNDYVQLFGTSDAAETYISYNASLLAQQIQ